MRIDRKFRKRGKVLAIIAIFSFILMSTLLVSAGVSALYFVNNQLKGQDFHGHFAAIEARWRSLPSVDATNCWGKVQSLLNQEPWISTPVAVNLGSLKEACLNGNITKI